MAAQKAPTIEPERSNFRQLIIQNPNYFGNIKLSPFKPVKQLITNTSYEELGCVGFQPQLNLLNAIVYVKKPFGYGGGLCTAGSEEYVRFYVSYDGGITWTDLGLTAFTAFDVPEPPNQPAFQRLEYAVTLPFKPPRKFCFVNNFAIVRAILSWNVQPPPNDPTFQPVWGNIHDTNIKIDPRPNIILSEALKELSVGSDKLAQAIDLNQEVKTTAAKALTLAEVQGLYAKQDVPPHRYALASLNQAVETTPDVRLMSANFAGATSILGAEFDVAAALAAIAQANGDTSYEQLECIGFNENTFTMEGVIRIKRPNGFNGGPCTAGSQEYVTFWADLDHNGTFSHCLGTASVNVHDTTNLPQGGLEYAVELPTTLLLYRQPCSKGPVLIPIRAILSWQAIPPCGNPNYVPVWGNRLETLICLPPGPSTQPGQQQALFDTVGSMSVTKINSVTGLADGTSTVGFTAVQSPFGGEVSIKGYILPASNLSAGAAPFKYKISYSNDGGATWTPITDKFTISRQLVPFGGLPVALPDINQTVDPGGPTQDFYTYQADWITGPGDAFILVSDNLLAKWQTLGKPDGLYQLKMDVYDPSTNTFFAAINNATILLDNTAPSTFINITSGGGSCGDFHVTDKITGSYSASDLHFWQLGLTLLPPSGGSFTAPVPLPRFWTDPGASTFGDSGSWTLDTTGLPPCGYVVVLDAYDRTIVNSGFMGNHGQSSVGFCLKAK